MKPEKLLIKPEEVESFTAVYQIMTHARDRYPDKAAYRQIESKTEESEISFSRFAGNVEALRAALLARGCRGKHIAVFGETSQEWINAYLAIVSGVGVCVPIDKELPVETIVTQLDFADVDLVFCSAKGLKKLGKALPLSENVNSVVVMRAADVTEVPGCENVVSMAALIEEGEALLEKNGAAALPDSIDPDETCLIIYTSGTTGANKGVMLSNCNIMGTLRGCARLQHYPDTSISVLPVNHSFELHAHLMSCMYCGTTVCLNDDLKHLLKNLERFKPEMSCMVPVMLELIVKKLKKQIADSGKEAQFNRMVRISNALRISKIDLRRKFFRQILEPLGGNLRMIICGGAALSQDTIDFLGNIGIQVYNGYGITECSPVAAVNPIRRARRFSVGYILPTADVRIVDPDEDGNGEIQIRGDNVMQGYYKAPEDTAQVFTEDGWFRTGDLGHIDKDGFLYICGRLKNLIILPNGKNISPEEVEDHLMQKMPYIKECVVYADAENTGIYALIYPDPDFCKETGLSSPESVKAFMQNDMDDYNREAPGFKRISDFEITEKEFEKSTTHKIQRFKIAAVNHKKESVQHV